MTQDEKLEQHAIAIRVMQESLNSISSLLQEKCDKADLNACLDRLVPGYEKISQLNFEIANHVTALQAQVEMLRSEVLEMKQAGNSKN